MKDVTSLALPLKTKAGHTGLGMGVGGGSVIVGRRKADRAACRRKLLAVKGALPPEDGMPCALPGQGHGPSVRLRPPSDLYMQHTTV